MTTARKNLLVITCEHGGRNVPAGWAALFLGYEALLETHRGWDPGALELGQQMAQRFGVPLHAATTTRLLVDLNRSVGHRQLFSEVTRALSPARRQDIVARHYRPYRDAVESAIAGYVACGHRVIHIASHSFTPMLGGVERRADVAWLYDPRRRGERDFAKQWMMNLAQHAPALCLRRNYPYQGRGDGLTSLLRKRFSEDAYVGIELELNQRFVLAGGAPWDMLRTVVIDSLATTLGLASAKPTT